VPRKPPRASRSLHATTAPGSIARMASSRAAYAVDVKKMNAKATKRT